MESRYFIYDLEQDLLIRCERWTPKTFVETFHWHRSFEIGYCLSGGGHFYFGDKVYPVRQGDIFIVNNLERHIAQSDEADPSRFLFVYFDPLLLEQERELMLPFIYSPLRFSNRMPGSLPLAGEIGELLLRLEQENAARQPAYRSMMQCLLLQICTLVLRHYHSMLVKEDFVEVYSQYNHVKPALDYMHEHFRHSLELVDIARVLNLSTSRSRHLFKEALGEGFKAYLLHLRVNEAKRLLTQSEQSVTEISLSCGFQSHNPFYRAFKDIVGMTPQEYRERSREKVK